MPELRLTLDRYEATYVDELHPIEYRAEFRVAGPWETPRWVTLKVNEPWSHRFTDFILHRHGYTPRFLLRDKQGNAIFDRFINLSVAGLQEDTFSLPEVGLKVDALFFPDLKVTDEGEALNQSHYLRNPAFRLRIRHGAKILYEGFAHPGQEIELWLPHPDDGKSETMFLSFSEVRQWVSLRVVRETGLLMIFIALFGGTLSLGLRFWDTERRLWAEPSDGGFRLRSHSPHCPALFEEAMDTLLQTLETKRDSS